MKQPPDEYHILGELSRAVTRNWLYLCALPWDTVREIAAGSSRIELDRLLSIGQTLTESYEAIKSRYPEDDTGLCASYKAVAIFRAEILSREGME